MMTVTNQPTLADLAGLSNKNLVLIATAAIGTAFLPTWIGWMREVVPEINLRVVLTPRAGRFVGIDAVTAFARQPITIDDWDDTNGEPRHVQLADWADCFLVHPATMDFVSRLSAGLCDSPTLLTLQGTDAPVVVAASCPPGFVDGDAWAGYVSSFAKRRNITLLPPTVGVSISDLDRAGSPAELFPVALATLARKLTAGAEGVSQ